jgi:hypothetical protein
MHTNSGHQKVKLKKKRKAFLPVVVTDTVVNVGTVMVELLDAAITVATVLGSQRLYRTTRVAQLSERVIPLLPLVKVGHLKKKNNFNL